MVQGWGYQYDQVGVENLVLYCLDVGVCGLDVEVCGLVVCLLVDLSAV